MYVHGLLDNNKITAAVFQCCKRTISIPLQRRDKIENVLCVCTWGSFCSSAVAVQSCVSDTVVFQPPAADTVVFQPPAADTVVVQPPAADIRQAATVPSVRASCTVGTVAHKLLLGVREQNPVAVHVLYKKLSH